MNVYPVGPVRFVFANLIANFGMEDFRPSTRHAAQPGIFKLRQDFSRWQFCQKFKSVNLYRGPSFEMQLRVGIMQDLQQV